MWGGTVQEIHSTGSFHQGCSSAVEAIENTARPQQIIKGRLDLDFKFYIHHTPLKTDFAITNLLVLQTRRLTIPTGEYKIVKIKPSKQSGIY